MEQTAVWCVIGAGLVALGLVKLIRRGKELLAEWRVYSERLRVSNEQNARILIAIQYLTLPRTETDG